MIVKFLHLSDCFSGMLLMDTIVVFVFSNSPAWIFNVLMILSLSYIGVFLGNKQAIILLERTNTKMLKGNPLLKVYMWEWWWLIAKQKCVCVQNLTDFTGHKATCAVLWWDVIRTNPNNKIMINWMVWNLLITIDLFFYSDLRIFKVIYDYS